MAGQQFCLRWNNHQTNLLSVFDKLLLKESFVDVTLACEGKCVKAHKVVLSACSPFFEEILENNPCKHPVIILKDLRYVDLKAIVQFMYKGEVNVSQEQLSQIIKTAEALKIKGLAEMGSDDKSQSESSLRPPSPPRRPDQHIQPVKRKHDNPAPVSAPRQFPNKNVSNQIRQSMPESRLQSQNLQSSHESPSFANVKFSRISSSSPHNVERSMPSPSMTPNLPHKRIEENLQPVEFTNSPEVMTSVPQATIKHEPTPPPDDPDEQIEPAQSEYMMEPTACDEDLPLEPDLDSRTSQNNFKSEIQYEEVNLSDSPPPDLPMGMIYNETSMSESNSVPAAGPSSLQDNSDGDQLTGVVNSDLENLVQFCKDSIVCSVCLRTYSTRRNCIRHIKHTHGPERGKVFNCLYCTTKFKWDTALKRHVKSKHPSEGYTN